MNKIKWFCKLQRDRCNCKKCLCDGTKMLIYESICVLSETKKIKYVNIYFQYFVKFFLIETKKIYFTF